MLRWVQAKRGLLEAIVDEDWIMRLVGALLALLLWLLAAPGRGLQWLARCCRRRPRPQDAAVGATWRWEPLRPF